jgi:hypothetical protein
MTPAYSSGTYRIGTTADRESVGILDSSKMRISPSNRKLVSKQILLVYEGP